MFFCGHTCCDVCAEKAPRCPLCDQEISGRTDNIVVQQAAERRVCEHPSKALFCPLCCLAICIDCLVSHSYHGVLPLDDPKVQEILQNREQEERTRLESEKTVLEKRLQEVSQQHYELSEVWRDMQERTTEAFAALHQLLVHRETEVMETLREAALPLISRLLAVSSELSLSLQSVNTALKALDKAGISHVSASFPIIQSQVPAQRLSFLHDSPEMWELTLDLSPIYTAISAFGHFSKASESPSFSLI